MKIAYLFFLLVFILLSCNQQAQFKISEQEHAEEIASWDSKRIESLKKEEGWLNIIGLFWLETGENSFGSSQDSDLFVDDRDVPATLGIFTLENDKVYFTPQGEGLYLQERPITAKELIYDAETNGSPTLSFNTLKWNVIKRGDVYGIRLRDLESEAVTEFTGVDRYPVSIDWRIEAKFIPYEPAKAIDITNVLGQTSANPSPGYVEFERDSKVYKIDALEGGDELFLILADETSGGETYGGGRYVYVKKPTGSENVILDFNKAYNPPCVFTPYATCPLPPRQNILDLAITAGEKNFGEH